MLRTCIIRVKLRATNSVQTIKVSITMALDRSTQWFDENACSGRAEDPSSPSGQSSAVFSKAVVQGCLANVNARIFSTWDAVHYSLSVVCLCNAGGNDSIMKFNGNGNQQSVGKAQQHTHVLH